MHLLREICGFTPRRSDASTQALRWTHDSGKADAVLPVCSRRAVAAWPLKTFPLPASGCKLRLVVNNTETGRVLHLFLQRCDCCGGYSDLAAGGCMIPNCNEVEVLYSSSGFRIVLGKSA